MSLSAYCDRRVRLLSGLPEGSVAILPAARQVVRSRDTYYPFRQDSDFWYLTGFPEPDAVLVMVPGRVHGQMILFCHEPDPKTALWEGEQIGPERAVAEFGFDDAFPLSDIDDILPGLMEGREHVYFTVGVHRDFDQKILALMAHLREHRGALSHVPSDLVDLGRIIHEMRLIKDASELDVMRRAAQISVEAHKAAMKAARSGVYEYQLEAELNYVFARAGARSPAYPAIVGSGENACVLHYAANDKCLRDGELVLIDAGCEYQMYASDITRTFPVSGVFSGPQRELYEVVLRAQEAAIAALAPGRSWQDSHSASVSAITEGLWNLGILQGDLKELIETVACQKYYMHRVGHWLGLDVHDVGDYQEAGRWRNLAPGMVTTVEPGIYIPSTCTDVAEQWRGIGIRIEDDAVITETGVDLLTVGAPKTVEEIELWMR
jgi:Xaa-Pro aminopeptidase